MGWPEQVSAIATVGGTIATVGGTVISYVSLRKLEKKNNENIDLRNILQGTYLKGVYDNRVLKKLVQKLEKAYPDSPILKELKQEILDNINFFEHELREFKDSFEYCQEAGRWLERYKEVLSKEAGDAALQTHHNLMKNDSNADSQEKVKRFYRTIEAYLAWTAYNLKECQYIPLGKPIPLVLPAETYITAFSFIRDNFQKLNVSEYPSSKATEELKNCINDLILEMS